mmetsp:Transcript_24996/g.58146  ORF Transcript_24996/g.58146 Transcript_24996/m.58146 type:complete len:311 (-) Transcript_24996:106-1038(-)
MSQPPRMPKAMPLMAPLLAFCFLDTLMAHTQFAEVSDNAIAEAALEDDACPVGSSAAGCALHLYQLRAHRHAPEEPQPVQDDVAEMRSSLAEVNSLTRAENSTEANASDGEVPGGWGEAANYADLSPGPQQDVSQDLNSGWFLGSCALYGCVSSFAPTHSCQCNDACQHFSNCCPDFWSRCHSNPGASPPVQQQQRIMTLYHQTSPQACQMILRNNFRPGHAGWCGGGIYFAMSPEETYSKAIGPDSHKGCILRAQVDVGRVLHLGRRCGRMSLHRLQAMHYDSVSFNPGDGQEYVVYSSSRVLLIDRVK